MIEKVIVRLKKDTGKNIEFIKLNYCQYRINGLVDLYLPSWKLWIRDSDIWIREGTKEERYEILKNLVKKNEKIEPFKKSENGKMTYQEFKHKMKKLKYGKRKD